MELLLFQVARHLALLFKVRLTIDIIFEGEAVERYYFSIRPLHIFDLFTSRTRSMRRVHELFDWPEVRLTIDIIFQSEAVERYLFSIRGEVA